MSRAIDEWVGKTDDAAIPPRVKSRVLKRHNDQCAECHRDLGGREKPQFDHIIALINSGRHAEFNLQPLCGLCHGAKTKADVAEKSSVAKRRSSFMGLREKKKWGGGTFRKSQPQNSSRKSTKTVLYSSRSAT